MSKVQVGGHEVAAAERALHCELFRAALGDIHPTCVIGVVDIDEPEGEAGGIVVLVQHGHLLVDALGDHGVVYGGVAVDDVDIGVNLDIEDIAGRRLMGLASLLVVQILVVRPLLWRGPACTAAGGCEGAEAEEDGEETHCETGVLMIVVIIVMMMMRMIEPSASKRPSLYALFCGFIVAMLRIRACSTGLYGVYWLTAGQPRPAADLLPCAL